MRKIRNTLDAIRLGKLATYNQAQRIERQRDRLYVKYREAVQGDKLSRAVAISEALELRREALMSYKAEQDWIRAMDWLKETAKGSIDG